MQKNPASQKFAGFLVVRPVGINQVSIGVKETCIFLFGKLQVVT